MKVKTQKNLNHFFRLKRLISSRSHPAIPRDNKIEILKVFKRKGEMVRNSDTGKTCHFFCKKVKKVKQMPEVSNG